MPRLTKFILYAFTTIIWPLSALLYAFGPTPYHLEILALITIGLTAVIGLIFGSLLPIKVAAVVIWTIYFIGIPIHLMFIIKERFKSDFVNDLMIILMDASFGLFLGLILGYSFWV